MTRCCVDCGTYEGVAIDMLCDGCLDERAAANRHRQGLPPTVTDRQALARIATILRPAAAWTASAPEARDATRRASSCSDAVAPASSDAVHGAAEPTASFRRGSRSRQTSAVAVGASAAPTRKKSGPTRDVSGVAGGTAPTSPAA